MAMKARAKKNPKGTLLSRVLKTHKVREGPPPVKSEARRRVAAADTVEHQPIRDLKGGARREAFKFGVRMGKKRVDMRSFLKEQNVWKKGHFESLRESGLSKRRAHVVTCVNSGISMVGMEFGRMIRAASEWEGKRARRGPAPRLAFGKT